MAKKQIRRNFKDSLFRMIFREKKELLSLYNAVNGSDYDRPEELELYTIEDVIYMGMKNDAAFLIDDVLNLYEAQSTWNPNMPLRGVFYFSQLYQGYLEGNHLDCYSKVRLNLLFPHYLVFYNGLKAEEDVVTLRLSDSFAREDGRECALECVATLLNINYGHNKEVMRNCRKLYEYSYLVEEIRKNLDQGIRLDAAVDRAVGVCIREKILEDLLRKHRAEVKEVILEEYNEELHIKSEKELSYLEGKAVGEAEGRVAGEAEGRAAGEAAGRAEGMSGVIRIIRRKLSAGVPAGEAAELLELETEYVCRIEELLMNCPEETDVQIAARYLEETAADQKK